MKLKNKRHSNSLGSFSGPVYSHLGRGKKLGVPTANVKLSQPFEHGVYFSETFLNHTWHPSITFIGIPETFESDTQERTETHILDGDFELVGKEITVELLQFVRKNKKFSSLEELVQTIQKDLTQARSYFGADIRQS